MRNIILFIVGLLIVGWLYNAATKSRTLTDNTPSAEKQESTKSTDATAIPPSVRASARIHEYALSPYTRAQYPKLFAKWGTKGIKRAEKLRKTAAEKASISADCDAIEIVEVSDQRSVPPNQMVIFVDCTNTHRFYFTEAELADRTSAVVSEAQKGKAVTAAEAKQTCVAAFKAGGRYSNDLAYNFHTIAPDFVESTGRWVVELIAPTSEKAKLAPSWARCIIVPGQPVVVDYADY